MYDMETIEIIGKMRETWSYMLSKMNNMKKLGNKQRWYENALRYKVFWQDIEPDKAEAIQKEWERNWRDKFWKAAG